MFGFSAFPLSFLLFSSHPNFLPVHAASSCQFDHDCNYDGCLHTDMGQLVPHCMKNTCFHGYEDGDCNGKEDGRLAAINQLGEQSFCFSKPARRELESSRVEESLESSRKLEPEEQKRGRNEYHGVEDAQWYWEQHGEQEIGWCETKMDAESCFDAGCQWWPADLVNSLRDNHGTVGRGGEMEEGM